MLLRRIYYLLKPILPWKLRMAGRRLVAERWRRRFAGSWPINPLAGRMPEGWPGWPNGKKFAFVLTHDVEGTKGLNQCRQLAELDMRMGFRAAFNFVPEGEYETPKALREFLVANGFEIGVQDLHHDGKLYSSRQAFMENARKINRYLQEWGAVGFRSGLMHHNLDWLRDLNVLYDSSTFDTDPFEPQPDGVNTIFPFWVPRQNGSGYVELPYTLPQDSTIFLLFQENNIDTWKQKLDWVAQHGGMALLNVHPDYMNFDGGSGFQSYDVALYRSFLEYVAERYGDQAWLALPREVAEHIRAMRAPAPRQAVSTAMSEPGEGPLLPVAEVPNSSRELQGKRVGMVLFSFYPDDPRPRRAAEALVSQGMSVELICLRENPADPKHEVVNGVEVRRLPMTRKRGGVAGYLFQYSVFLFLSAMILGLRAFSRRYHLVYVHNMPDVLVFSGLVPKLFGAKVILDLHDPMPELMMTIFGLPAEAKSVRLLKLLERWSLAFADSVVTVNRACAKIFGARSCAPAKVRVVMNSPDEGIFRFRPAQAPESPQNPSRPFVIMYHGSLVERNGLDLAVEAFARVRQSIPTAELRIYGSRNAFLEKVMASVREMGLEDSVHFLGPRPLEGIVEAIGQCDVGVIPNQRSIFTELNTPTRIFEYLALGKPAIAPRAPGITDYFDDGSLIFFELGNAENLARSIESVFRNPEEALRITRRGQEVHQTHTWREEKQRLTRLVSELLCVKDSRVAAVPQKPEPVKPL